MVIYYLDILNALQARINEGKGLTEKEAKMNNKLVEWAYNDKHWGDTMGTYEFLCKECKEVIEVQMKMSEYKHLEQCPGCKSMDIERIYKPVAIDRNAKGFCGIIHKK